ncbi:hypothetical protein B0H14DRAFT_3853950 [Mycena olivaceomarginata]|nr:hypothetical protein B0H14DRAFT_3853950 [Mycena olivaceomarginata]
MSNGNDTEQCHLTSESPALLSPITCEFTSTNIVIASVYKRLVLTFLSFLPPPSRAALDYFSLSFCCIIYYSLETSLPPLITLVSPASSHPPPHFHLFTPPHLTLTSTRGASAASPLLNLTGSFVDEGYLEIVELLTTEADNSSQVYYAFDTTTHMPYAYKRMRNPAPGFADDPRAGGDNEYLCLVLNPATGDPSNSILQRQRYFDRPRLVKELFLMLADAVAECHNAGTTATSVLEIFGVIQKGGVCGLRILRRRRGTRREEQSGDFRWGDLAYISPECANSTGAGASYSPRQSDLSVLAPSDESYAAFRADEENHFIETFQITSAAPAFFRRCLAAQAADRPTLDDMIIAVLEIDDRFSLSRRLAVHSHSKLFLRPVPGGVIGDVRSLIARGVVLQLGRAS